MDAGQVAVQGTPREVFSEQPHERLRSFLSRIEMRH
jgi:ABC-type polar amino acid transport system ATPase subunit